MVTKMDRFRGFGEVSRRSAFYVDSWHYELEWWSKCSSLERQIAEPRVYPWSIETRAFVAFSRCAKARARPRRMNASRHVLKDGGALASESGAALSQAPCALIASSRIEPRMSTVCFPSSMLASAG